MVLVDDGECRGLFFRHICDKCILQTTTSTRRSFSFFISRYNNNANANVMKTLLNQIYEETEPFDSNRQCRLLTFKQRPTVSL